MVTEVDARRRRALRAAAVAAMALGLSGCGYLLQAAHGQWRLMRARVPIARVLADPATPDPLRARLGTLQAARAFAVRELALPDNRSYTTYAALGRPYAVWNVVAAPPYSVAPRQWCFPVTGCIAYRGYFREADARRYAARLAARGDDVLVAGVAAYSTLGHFADPVLDTMLGRSDTDLAGTMFHELAHQLVYLKGDSAFNEGFAMSVERAGVARWLESRGRGGELAGWLLRQQRHAEVTAMLAAGRLQLAALYAQPMAEGEKRAAKAAALAAIAARVREWERANGAASGYGAWLEEGLNNAHLAAVGTYFDCVPGFERLLDRAGGSLPAYYAQVRALARGPAAARRALCAPADAAAPPGPAG